MTEKKAVNLGLQPFSYAEVTPHMLDRRGLALDIARRRAL
jgi:hypothetical protein